MFFAGMKLNINAKIEWRRDEGVLAAISLDRNFELRVKKNFHTVTVVVGTAETRINDPLDVRNLVPPA
jgi:hypothetical protein